MKIALMALLLLAGCQTTPKPVAPKPDPIQNNTVQPGDTNAWPRRGWN